MRFLVIGEISKHKHCTTDQIAVATVQSLANGTLFYKDELKEMSHTKNDDAHMCESERKKKNDGTA